LVLTAEPVLEPPELLRKECVRSGVEADEFLVPALGETVLFESVSQYCGISSGCKLE
jgi:hypothetical protein